MKTWNEIRKALSEQPDPKFIKPPDESKGIFGAYLEGSYVIAVLDEVFGTEGWGVDGYPSLLWEDGVSGLVRWRLYSCQGSAHFIGLNDENELVTCTKHDVGTCIAQIRARQVQSEPPPLQPQQLETAQKGAMTDLIKRCARQLGAKSGLWLYFDEKEASALFLGAEYKTDPKAEPVQQPHPRVEMQSHPSGDGDEGPLVFPGKYGKSDKPEFVQAVADACNEHGKITAARLVEIVGESALGYLKWMVDKNKFDTGQYAAQNKAMAAKLEAWLGKRAPSPEEPVPDGVSVRKQLVVLLQAAQDDAVITAPIKGSLTKLLESAGYENEFAWNGLIRKYSGDEHLNLSGLTVKRAKALTGYLAYLIDNDPKSKFTKEFAHSILASAWASNVGWKEACDRMANLESPDLDSLCKSINPKLSWGDVEPLLVGQCWPSPAPQDKVSKFLQMCTEKGYTILDKNAQLLAKAVAQGEGWTK